MCVIIDRAPGVVIPFEKIDSACNVNPHGWGLSVVDRGQLITQRGYDPKGNDAEHIYREMERAKDQQIFLHLRYCTVGDKNLDNTHPFPVLNKKDHGIDLAMMHNGTISGMKHKETTASDSAIFADTICTPLFESFIGLHGVEKGLAHPALARILKEFTGINSKLVFFDNENNKLFINKQEGKDFDGWWASNDYSFNRTYRERTYNTNNTYYQGAAAASKDSSKNVNSVGSSNSGSSGANSTNSSLDGKGPSAANPTQTTSSTGPTRTGTAVHGTALIKSPDTTKVKDEGKTLGNNLSSFRTKGSPSAVRRDTFCQLVGINSLSGISGMDLEDIEEMVVNFPQLASYLIADLFLALYHQDVNEMRSTSRSSTPLVNNNTEVMH